MILGIDVGGTHTDAVLIENFKIKKKAKVLTNEISLVDSLLNVTGEIFRDEDSLDLERIVLSTTISTNAIVQGKTGRVGLILASGPGLPPSALKINADARFISGYVNHRGIEIAGIDHDEVSQVCEYFKKKGVKNAGIVGKFSTRNFKQEMEIRDIINDDFKHISLGHQMSGHLNFPRRVSTTYLNAAIWDLYTNFVKEISGFLGQGESGPPIYILKADGGTFEIDKSVEYPAQTILSGPAASIMGILSLTDCRKDAIALDIGGTTTDIAIFASGVPLLEPLGVTIEDHKTLIRGLRTKSIGIGGDSRVRYKSNRIIIGPERDGPAAAFGGSSPTPTDAMIILGLTNIGDKEKATAAISPIAKEMNCPVHETAKMIFDLTCQKIATSVKEMIEEINNRPVYTIHELLEDKKLIPQVLNVVGGPAKPMAEHLGKLLECPAHIPEHAEVANAIGAALARTTTELTLLADTERKTMTIVEEGIQTTIPDNFSREDALKTCKEKLLERSLKMGANKEDIDMEIIEDQEFNMVRGFYTTGKNIRVKVQVKPGLITGLGKG
jgi:N-methylhydantoinase A/oxoprolinase/acetone carboxylase beta subunit